MTTKSFTLMGVYFDGEHPQGRKSELVLSKGTSVLQSVDFSETYRTSRLRVSPAVGAAPRFITFPDGGQLLCKNQRILNWFPQDVRSEKMVSWLEEHISVAVACVFIITALLAGGYFYGLPAAAKSVVQRVPLESEKALGNEALSWLDDHGWFKPTEVDEQRRQAIQDGFNGLAATLPLQQQLQLEFRSSKQIGPNAFALPGGTIVITDQMIELAQSDDEIIAVLAHEMGHVEHRHALRQILQGSIVAVAVASITGDASTAGAAITGIPVAALSTKYSRKHEREADDFAFDLLNRSNLSPESFATIKGLTTTAPKCSASSPLTPSPQSASKAQETRPDSCVAPYFPAPSTVAAPSAINRQCWIRRWRFCLFQLSDFNSICLL